MERSYNLTGAKTSENLAKAFAGESQARTRYLFYSEVAKKEGYPTLEQLFLATADNERGHAEIFFEYLTKGLSKTILQPQVLVPVALGSTKQNLQAAAEGEYAEWTNLYPEFARVAQKEGFQDIAISFQDIATIEGRHNERFVYMLEKLNANMLYSSPIEVTWMCTNCGLHIQGKNAPKICPACHHPQSYFKTIFDDLYPLD